MIAAVLVDAGIGAALWRQNYSLRRCVGHHLIAAPFVGERQIRASLGGQADAGIARKVTWLV
jgi:hypothetical protein